MKITSDLTNLTTAVLILTVQMFIEWTLFFNEDFKFYLKFFSVFNIVYFEDTRLI
jgi:hypothetical protein